MAANHQYMHRIEVDGWRFTLAIRCGSDADTTTFTEYVLPPDAVDIIKYGRGYDKTPIGMPNAMSLDLDVDLDELSGTEELEYLRDCISASCFILSDGSLDYNVFILRSDRGNGELAEEEFYAEAVTVQRPTLEEEQDLTSTRGMIQLTTIDALKVYMETRKIEDLYSFGISTMYGDAKDNDAITYEVFTDSFNKATISLGTTGTPTLKMRSQPDVMRTIAQDVWHGAASIVRKRTVHAPTYSAFLSGKSINPWAHWKFYGQYGADQNEQGVLLSEDNIWIISQIIDADDGVIGGYESSRSRFSPVSRYPNWHDYTVDMAEHAVTKAMPTWNEDLFPVIEYAPIFAGTPVAMAFEDFTSFKRSRGYNVCRSCKVTINQRNTPQDKVTPGDLTEAEIKTVNSLSSDDYNVKALLHNNQPEAYARNINGTPKGVESNYTWVDGLYYYADPDGRPTMVHPKCTVTDGVDEYASTDDLVDAFYTVEVNADDNFEYAKVIRSNQEIAGMPLIVAKAIHGAFGRIRQSKVDASCDLRAELVPMNTGTMFNITVPTHVQERTGTDSVWTCVFLESYVDVKNGSISCSFFVKG
jgi:hypothetical protein